MEVPKEEENFFRACKVINDDMLEQLREYFKTNWVGQFKSVWTDSSKDGKDLWKKLPGWKPREETIKQNLQSGKSDEWDGTCLFHAISVLNNDKSKIKFKEKCWIDNLKKLRNEISHKPHFKLSDQEKGNFFKTLIEAYTKLRWNTVAVKKIETATITTEDMKKLKAKLESEKKAGKAMTICGRE